MQLEVLFTATAIASLFITNFNRCSSPRSTKPPSKSAAANTYLTVIFWHSIFITASTPLLRLVYSRWYAHTPLHSLFSSYTSSRSSASLPSSFPYPTSADSPHIDPAFFLHSLFGLLWVVVGHVTLLYSHRWGRKAHRRMGYVAITSFVLHMSAALYTVFADVARHHPLPRIMLLLNPAMSLRFMFGAIAVARRGDLREHQDLMLRVYLYSTEGAGTIRQVEHFMWMLHAGPGLCQFRHGSFATSCVWPYVVRLILTRMLTQYHLAVVARLREDEGLYKSVVREVRGFLCAAGGLCAITYTLGLEQMGGLLQAGGYFVLLAIELCITKPGVERLKGMHSVLGRGIVLWRKKSEFSGLDDAGLNDKAD